MVAAASLARSRAVVKVTPSSGQPLVLPKLLLAIPSRFASAFIKAA